MRIKQFLWDLMPYGLYKNLMSKRHPDIFTREYKEYLSVKSNNRCSECLSKDPVKSYKSIVSIEGLGYSGSGAIIDYLSEIDSCFVLRNANKKIKNRVSHFELDFLRLAGGLFEFEHYLSSNNIFQNDAMVNRLVSYLNHFPLFLYDKRIQYLFFEFLDNIIDLSIIDTHGVSPNFHLICDGKKTSMFFLRSMSVEEYRTLCRNFLSQFFNYINDESKDILVMDQLLCDQEFDMGKYKEYLPDCKTIMVYRDPRDVYAFAVQQNVEWIAHKDVNTFVKWFEIMTKKFDLKSNDYLVVQFEKFVTDYSNESKRVLAYLGIDECHHSEEFKRHYFNPDISIKNVGIWKNSSMSQGDFEMISRRLGDYCFDL